jgi:predicted SprT family Zn-dependent metalloprotease
VRNIAAAADVTLPTPTELQLLFARLNASHFGAELPAYHIRYNARMTSVAGRIVYRPAVIELSVRLLSAHPGHIENTMLHEMVHAWLHVRGLPSGHGQPFKRKMREVGLTSIYHSMPIPSRRSRRRYVLACPACGVEFLRRRRPGMPVSCARCAPAGYDRRYRMLIKEAQTR